MLGEGGKYVARFYREPIDAYITGGRSTLKQSDTVTLRVTTLRTTPTSIQWYLKSKLTVMPTIIAGATSEAYQFTMPAAEDGIVWVRAVVTDAQGRTVTAEKELICADCNATGVVAQMIAGRASIASSSIQVPDPIVQSGFDSYACALVARSQGSIQSAQTPPSRPVADEEIFHALSSSSLQPIPHEILCELPVPNPAQNETMIAWQQPEAAEVYITLHDAFGSVAAVLVQERTSAGRHTRIVDTRTLQTGTYTIRYRIGSQMHTQRFVVIH